MTLKRSDRWVVKHVFAVGWDDAEPVVSQQFCKEAILWNSLSHPNILKLTGVMGDLERCQFTTVSEWMTRGHIWEYIRKNATNRMELVRPSIFQVEFFILQVLSLTTVTRCGARAKISPRRKPCSWGHQTGVCLIIIGHVRRFLTSLRRTYS